MAAENSLFGLHSGPIPPIMDTEPPPMNVHSNDFDSDLFGNDEKTNNGEDDWCNFSGFVSSNTEPQPGSQWASFSPPPLSSPTPPLISPPSFKKQTNNESNALKAEDYSSQLQASVKQEFVQGNEEKPGLSLFYKDDSNGEKINDNNDNDFGNFSSGFNDNTSNLFNNVYGENDSVPLKQNDNFFKSSDNVENNHNSINDDFGTFTTNTTTDTDVSINNFGDFNSSENSKNNSMKIDNGGSSKTENNDNQNFVDCTDSKTQNNDKQSINTHDFFGDFSNTEIKKQTNNLNNIEITSKLENNDSSILSENQKFKVSYGDNVEVSNNVDFFGRELSVSSQQCITIIDTSDAFPKLSEEKEIQEVSNLSTSGDCETIELVDSGIDFQSIKNPETSDISSSILTDGQLEETYKESNDNVTPSNLSTNEFGAFDNNASVAIGESRAHDFGNFNDNLKIVETSREDSSNNDIQNVNLSNRNNIVQAESFFGDFGNINSIENVNEKPSWGNNGETSFGNFGDFSFNQENEKETASQDENSLENKSNSQTQDELKLEPKSTFSDFDAVNSNQGIEYNDESSESAKEENEFDSNKQGNEFGEFSSNKRENDFGEFGSTKDENEFGEFGSNKQENEFGEFGLNKRENDFGEFGSTKDEIGFGEFGSNKQENEFGNFSLNKQENEFGDFGSNKQENEFGDFGSNKQENEFGEFGSNKQENEFGDFGSNKQENEFGDSGSNKQENEFGDFGSNKQENEFGDFGSNKQENEFGDFGSNKQENEFGEFGSNKQENEFGEFGSNKQENEFGEFDSNRQENEFGDLGNQEKRDTSFGAFGTINSNENSDNNNKKNGFGDFNTSNKTEGDFGNFGTFESTTNDDESGDKSSSFAAFETTPSSDSWAAFPTSTSTSAQQAKVNVKSSVLSGACSQALLSSFGSTISNRITEDDSSKHRIYELLDHLKNSYKPESELTLWDELQLAKNDDERWLLYYFSSNSFKKQIASFSFDYKDIKLRAHQKSVGRLTPSLSPSTSIGSFEMEFGILVPEQAIVVSKNTLLAQSQNKKLSSNLIERIPSLSSLKKEDGSSEPTSETASLDLDFFMSGTQANRPNSAPKEGSTKDSTGTLDLLDIVFSDTKDDTNATPSLPAASQVQNDFSNFTLNPTVEDHQSKTDTLGDFTTSMAANDFGTTSSDEQLGAEPIDKNITSAFTDFSSSISAAGFASFHQPQPTTQLSNNTDDKYAIFNNLSTEPPPMDNMPDANINTENPQSTSIESSFSRFGDLSKPPALSINTIVDDKYSAFSMLETEPPPLQSDSSVSIDNNTQPFGQVSADFGSFPDTSAPAAPVNSDEIFGAFSDEPPSLNNDSSEKDFFSQPASLGNSSINEFAEFSSSSNTYMSMSLETNIVNSEPYSAHPSRNASVPADEFGSFSSDLESFPQSPDINITTEKFGDFPSPKKVTNNDNAFSEFGMFSTEKTPSESSSSATTKSGLGDFGQFESNSNEITDTQSEFGKFNVTSSVSPIAPPVQNTDKIEGSSDFGNFADFGDMTNSENPIASTEFGNFGGFGGMTSSANLVVPLPVNTTVKSDDSFGDFSNFTSMGNDSLPVKPAVTTSLNKSESVPGFDLFSKHQQPASVIPKIPMIAKEEILNPSFADFSQPVEAKTVGPQNATLINEQPPSMSETSADCGTFAEPSQSSSGNTEFANFSGFANEPLNPTSFSVFPQQQPSEQNTDDKYAVFNTFSQQSTTTQIDPSDKYSAFSSISQESDINSFSVPSTVSTVSNIVAPISTTDVGSSNTHSTQNDFGNFGSFSDANSSVSKSALFGNPPVVSVQGNNQNTIDSIQVNVNMNTCFGNFHTPQSSFSTVVTTIADAPMTSVSSNDFGDFSTTLSANEKPSSENSAVNTFGDFAEFSSNDTPANDDSDFADFTSAPTHTEDFGNFTVAETANIRPPQHHQNIQLNKPIVSMTSNRISLDSSDNFGDFSEFSTTFQAVTTNHQSNDFSDFNSFSEVQPTSNNNSNNSNTFANFQQQQQQHVSGQFTGFEGFQMNLGQMPPTSGPVNFNMQQQQQYRQHQQQHFQQPFNQHQQPRNAFQNPGNFQQNFIGRGNMFPRNQQQQQQQRFRQQPASRMNTARNRFHQPARYQSANDPFASLSLADNAEKLHIPVNKSTFKKPKKSLNDMTVKSKTSNS